MSLNKEMLRYVRLLYRHGQGSEEIIDDIVETEIRPQLSRDVKKYVKMLKQEDLEALLDTLKGTEADV